MTCFLERPSDRFTYKHGIDCPCGSIHACAELVAHRQRNGVLRFRLRCPECGTDPGYNIPHRALSSKEIVAANVVKTAVDTAGCVRCGGPGGEDHHTSPTAAFGFGAEEWPIIRLCRHCHVEWHATMDAYYRGRFSR